MHSASIQALEKSVFFSEFKHWDHVICRQQMKPQT